MAYLSRRSLVTIAAIDFTTVEVWCRHGLVTVYVLFAIELRSRRVHFAGMTPSPDEAWIRQAGRNLTDPIDGFLCEKRFCLMDRDAKFTAAFRALLDDAGTESVRLPARSPNLKDQASHCTSFVRFGWTSGKRRRFDSLRPWLLTGASAPGCS